MIRAINANRGAMMAFKSHLKGCAMPRSLYALFDLYMYARKLQRELGYVKWENFHKVINRSISLVNGNDAHLFKKTSVLCKMPNRAVKKLIDYELNDSDIDLLKKMCGSHKPTASYKLRSETIIISLLIKYYASKDVLVSFQYRLGDYIFDCAVGGEVLFEFDEAHHLNSRVIRNDLLKQEYAIRNGYKVVRATIQDDIVDVIVKINKHIYAS